MRFIRKPLHLVSLVAICFVNVVYAEIVVKEITDHTDRWNRFATSLLAVNDHLEKCNVRTEESLGGYGGVTADLEFYRETRLYDNVTGNLLSNVKWEKKNPDNLHAIEVYIYDKSGRVKRDYAAAYLPVHRKTPIQTLINIHHYRESLRSYRQFDASDNLLYQQCKGLYKNNEVHISLEYHEIPDHQDEIENLQFREIYHACFDQIPLTAGPYLDPLKEIPFLD